MATTEDNLKEAFAGESQANRKYLAFAGKAEKEGFPNVAKLFRTAAEAEAIHAQGHLNSMGGVQSTADNLRAAMQGEIEEFTHMYPPMVEQAQSEKHRAGRMFEYALKAEAVHAALYRQALAAVEEGQDLAQPAIYLCPVCGYIELGAPPDACPVCGVKGERFVQV